MHSKTSNFFLPAQRHPIGKAYAERKWAVTLPGLALFFTGMTCDSLARQSVSQYKDIKAQDNAVKVDERLKTREIEASDHQKSRLTNYAVDSHSVSLSKKESSRYHS